MTGVSGRMDSPVPGDLHKNWLRLAGMVKLSQPKSLDKASAITSLFTRFGKRVLPKQQASAKSHHIRSVNENCDDGTGTGASPKYCIIIYMILIVAIVIFIIISQISFPASCFSLCGEPTPRSQHLLATILRK